MYQKTSGTGASASGARACSVCVASLCSASRRRLSEASTRTESRVVLAPAASPAPAVGPLFKLVCRFEWAQSDIRTWCRRALLAGVRDALDSAFRARRLLLRQLGAPRKRGLLRLSLLQLGSQRVAGLREVHDLLQSQRVQFSNWYVALSGHNLIFAPAAAESAPLRGRAPLPLRASAPS